MKTTIKKLAKDIDRILEQNAQANEMGALIDYGEWSQQAPDFTDLIKRWNLTREKLLQYCEIAEDNASLWFDHYPRKTNKPFRDLMNENSNPWYNILMNLHSIFMAGFLQEEKRKRKTSVQFGIYPDGHRPIN